MTVPVRHRMFAEAVVPLLAAIAIASCSTTAPTATPNAVTSSIAPLSGDELPLLTEAPGLVGEGCGGVGFNATLAGSVSDPRLVWLVAHGLGSSSASGRVDVVWPPGYRVRFSPTLEVLDGSDTVQLRGGDPVGGACALAAGLYLLEPPFR